MASRPSDTGRFSGNLRVGRQARRDAESFSSGRTYIVAIAPRHESALAQGRKLTRQDHESRS